jgi:hypothetical protein
MVVSFEKATFEITRFARENEKESWLEQSYEKSTHSVWSVEQSDKQPQKGWKRTYRPRKPGNVTKKDYCFQRQHSKDIKMIVRD